MPGNPLQPSALEQRDLTAPAITSDIALNLTPNPASVELGATQAFQAIVTSSGHPDTSTRWSISGPACISACGTVDASGNYTAPRTLPSPASVTLTAQSVADPSKQVSAVVSITSSFSLQISAPSSGSAQGTAAIVATLTPVPGSNPSSALPSIPHSSITRSLRCVGTWSAIQAGRRCKDASCPM